LAELRHGLLDTSGDGERVRTRRLEDGERAARLAVRATDLAIVERAELDAGDVAESDDRSVWIRSHRNPAKLLGRLQPPLRADGVTELLSGRHRLGADLAGRVDGALLLDGAHELGDREPELGQAIGLDPDPHRVVAGAEEAYLANARHAVERVDNVDVRVVGEEQRVVRVLRR